MDLTEEEVQKILRLVDELDYGEIHLEIGDLKIDLVKRRPSDHDAAPTFALQGVQSATSQSTTPESRRDVVLNGRPEPTEESAATPIPGAHVVLAPVAGTFYRAPAPGAKPFVEVGQHVAATDPVCLIEVMKLFQSIAAGAAGKIVQVLVANATAVAQGQALVAIEPETAS